MTFMNSQPVERSKPLSNTQRSSVRTFVRTLVAAAALVAVAPAAFAQVIVVPAATPVQEYVPAPRVGHQWHHGNWEWVHSRYVWMPGGWVAQAPVAYGVYQARPQRMSAPPPRVQRLSADALFPFDQGSVNDIRRAGMADLVQIAAQLRASPFGRVEVRGYTDRLGSDSYNLNLSIQRANAVKAVLVQQGVPAGKIRAEGLGSQDPVTQPCSSMAQGSLVRCLQPDRRVEIVTYVRS